jgi:hypothetical protein
LARAQSSDAALLEHVTVIDGAGAAPNPNQSVLIQAGKIAPLYPRGSRPTLGRQPLKT